LSLPSPFVPCSLEPLTVRTPRLRATDIDEYNHHMNSVDRANQLRSSMTVCRAQERRNWTPLWSYAINVSTNNAFICWKFDKPSNPRDHTEFQQDLAMVLLSYPLECEAISRGQVPEGLHNWPGHDWAKFQGINYCIWCRIVARARYRCQPLAEVINGARPEARSRGRRTTGGCKRCNVYLCSKGDCFDRFHSHKQL